MMNLSHIRPLQVLLTTVIISNVVHSFQGALPLLSMDRTATAFFASNEDTEEYRNVATKILSNFITPSNATNSMVDIKSSKKDPLSEIDFNAPKVRKIPIDILAQALDADLYKTEWFVTGKVNPTYFSDSFSFQDPDVKVKGIQDYAIGVNKIFDQETARAQILSTKVDSERADDNIITCTWRLSGKVNVGPGLTIKPYIVYTDFTVDPESGLIIFQEDRFDIPQWDILLSALFPFLVGVVTSPPAPVPEPRNPPPQMPNLSKFRRENMETTLPFGSIGTFLGNFKVGR
jgi:hypothetical protein